VDSWFPQKILKLMKQGRFQDVDSIFESAASFAGSGHQTFIFNIIFVLSPG
jgi:hypothetical protein